MVNQDEIDVLLDTTISKSLKMVGLFGQIN
jgi:hypothetical protein